MRGFFNKGGLFECYILPDFSNVIRNFPDSIYIVINVISIVANDHFQLSNYKVSFGCFGL
jgi:hypothetical protein